MLAAHLTDRGMSVQAVASGAAGLEACRAEAYDAVILDLGLPDMDGLDLLRLLRGLPVLILTARGGVDDRVHGLDAGADDYLVKPFAPEELEARLRALLRRPGLRAEREYSWQGLRFVAATRSLRRGDAGIELSPREAAVLESLLRADGQIVVRDRLAEPIREVDGEVSGNALEAVISRLRRKLAGLGPFRIDAIRGIGYRLGGN